MVPESVVAVDVAVVADVVDVAGSRSLDLGRTVHHYIVDLDGSGTVAVVLDLVEVQAGIANLGLADTDCPIGHGSRYLAAAGCTGNSCFVDMHHVLVLDHEIYLFDFRAVGNFGLDLAAYHRNLALPMLLLAL